MAARKSAPVIPAKDETCVHVARPDDETLLVRCARGDEAALAELYDRHGRVAYGLALRIVRDPDLAEDAVQEGFLSVWRTAGAFVGERAKVSTWILTLVHRRAVDLVRREQRRRTEPLADALDGPGVDVEEEASLRFQRRLVQRALRALPAEQREALELAYYGGFTQSELAEYLRVPLGTVKSRMFAGLRRLRQELEEAGLDGAPAFAVQPVASAGATRRTPARCRRTSTRLVSRLGTASLCGPAGRGGVRSRRSSKHSG